MDIRIAEPHGMCSGVARALCIAEEALSQHPGETLWCFHEIVHNEHVVNALKARGACFVQDINDVPEGARVLFSAHGVAPEVRDIAQQRRLKIVDATCPFVTKVHREARAYAADGLPIVLIGHAGHDEVVGVVGEAPEHIHVIAKEEEIDSLGLSPGCTLGLLSQTTVTHTLYSTLHDALKVRGFDIRHPKKHGICTATQERQDAIRALAKETDAILVIGSRNSSNSKRLVEVANAAGTPATLIESPEDVLALDLSAVKTLGITSGASTPETLIEATIARLKKEPLA